MFHLLLTMQEIATYKNAVKCKNTDDFAYDFKDGFLLYNQCGSVYCYGACGSTDNTCADNTNAPTNGNDDIIPVGDQFIISF